MSPGYDPGDTSDTYRAAGDKIGVSLEIPSQARGGISGRRRQIASRVFSQPHITPIGVEEFRALVSVRVHPPGSGRFVETSRTRGVHPNEDKRFYL